MIGKTNADLCVSILEKNYPNAECALIYEKDYELLFATRLSAQCTDVRVNMVTPTLFSRFPTLEDLASAEISEIEEIIKSCGLFRTKARDISLASVILIEKFNSKVPDNMEDLLSLPGIGRKTANLILGDIFKKPAIVADTHCIRLSNRIGFIKNNKNPLAVEMALKKIIDPEDQSDFCHRLVLHGRKICDARKPICTECCLNEICESYSI